MSEVKTPCKYMKCLRFATQLGYCQKHQPLPFAGGLRAKRLPADWQQRRLVVLRRDKYVCYVCGDKGADAVDHIQPGNNHEYDNLAAVHQNVKPYCHRLKTSREGNARQGHKVTDDVKEVFTVPQQVNFGFDNQ